MLSDLKKTLLKTNKYKLWQEAFVFSLCQEAVRDWLVQKNQDISVEDIKIFLKLTSKTLYIKLCCSDSTILSWLKVNNYELQEAVTSALSAHESLCELGLDLSFRRL